MYALRFTESILVLTIALATGSVQPASLFQAKCTVSVINTGRAKRVIFLTVKPIAAVQITVTATSPGKNRVSAMTVGKVSLRDVTRFETDSRI